MTTSENSRERKRQEGQKRYHSIGHRWLEQRLKRRGEDKQREEEPRLWTWLVEFSEAVKGFQVVINQKQSRAPFLLFLYILLQVYKREDLDRYFS